MFRQEIKIGMQEFVATYRYSLSSLTLYRSLLIFSWLQHWVQIHTRIQILFYFIVVGEMTSMRLSRSGKSQRILHVEDFRGDLAQKRDTSFSSASPTNEGWHTAFFWSCLWQGQAAVQHSRSQSTLIRSVAIILLYGQLSFYQPLLPSLWAARAHICTLY